ncbi:hypothetical protein [Frankia sp. CiP3]|nr:hypothetical protein [Frankia sp. CiP3]
MLRCAASLTGHATIHLGDTVTGLDYNIPIPVEAIHQIVDY